MDLQGILLFLPVLLFSVIAHEYAHGYAALRQGDQTALALGRLTWNPVKHIDPFMTILLPVMLWIVTQGRMVLGGAKPVPVDPRNYRHRVRGDIIVSLAGVATNLVIAVACAGAFALFGMAGRGASGLQQSFTILQAMMVIGITLNLILVAFNLIPIPPLDGSHVVKYLLPPAWAVRYQRIGFLGIVLIILVLNFAPGFLEWWFTPAMAAREVMLRSVVGYALPGLGDWIR